MGIRILIVIILHFSVIPFIEGQSIALLIGDKDFIELEFEYANGMIVIDAVLDNDHPIKLLLDTGAENLILFDPDIVTGRGYRSSKNIELRGADLDTMITASVFRRIPFSIEGCKTVMRDLIVLNRDHLDITKSIGIKVDGILGGRALWGLVLEIDYEKRKVRIHNHEHMKSLNLNKYHILGLEVRNHKPYIQTHLDLSNGNRVAAKILIDTGSSLGFLLLLDSAPSLKLPKNHIKGPIGRGFGGEIMGYISRIRSLRISEGVLFPHPLTHLQEKGLDITDEILNHRNGLMGNPLLSRFSLIIDYLEEKLYLKPISNYNRQDQYDKSGLVINAIGPNLNEFIVRYVLEDTPAAMADIRKGDKISKLGYLPIKWRDLTKVTNKLSGREGKKVKISVVRDGIELKKPIILSDYLKKLQN